MKSITIILTSTCLLTASQMLIAPVLADPNPVQPHLDYGGTKDRPPRTPTASATPNQIRLSKAIGDSVVSRGGGELGTIADAWIDHDGRVALVTLSGKRGAIPWSSLAFQGKPTPHFVVDLSAEDLRNAPPPSQGTGLRDVGKDLFGAKAVDDHGQDLGKVSDVVADFGSGKVDALVIETGNALLPKEEHAVAWSAVRAAPSSKVLVLSLSKDQLAQAPVMTTKAPEAAQSGTGAAGNNVVSGSSQAPPALSNSTVERVTGPADRR